MKLGTPKVVKSQAIADLVAQFPKEEEFSLDDEVPREVGTIEVVVKEWIMRFDGSSTTNSGVAEVALYHGEGETIALLFKLEFPY